MLKSNSQFITLLRKDKIAAPTVRKFSPEQWMQDYKSHGNGQPEEIVVYEAGLWVGHQLKQLWTKIHDMKLNQYRFESFVSTLFAIFVKNYRMVSVDSQIGSVSNSSGWADYELTALGDSLWRALNFLGGQKTQMAGSKSPEEGEVFQLLKFCSEIYVLEYFMGRVIHCGWRLQNDNSTVTFEPSSPYDHFLRNEAIGLNLRNDDLLEFVAVYQNGWDMGKFRDEAPHHLKLTGRTGHRANFSVVNSAPDRMPLTIPLFSMDIPKWMRSCLDIKACNVGDLTVSEILSGWLLIGQAFNEINTFELRDSSRSEYGCALTEADLIKVLKQFGWPKKKAGDVICFLTYQWRPHEDLWGSPLVKIGSTFYPFLPALLDTNLTRTIDLWLKKCQYKTANGKLDELIGPRGLAFEQYVRAELKGYMEKSPYVDGFVFPNASKIVGGDIDLLWRMNNLVIVADTKFNKFPANPNEIGNYYRELEHGTEQVETRIKKLNDKKSEVAKHLQWEGAPDDLEFQPLVVCGHPFGAGLAFNGVPCIQYDMLELLFCNPQFTMCARVDGTVQADDIAVPFVKQKGKFINFFKKYLAAPASVWFREPGLTSTMVTGAMLSAGVQIKFRRYSVAISNSVDRKSYCIERRDVWGRDFIDADV